MNQPAEKPEAFRRFEELAKKLLRVDKKEAGQKEAERPKRGQKPKRNA